MNLNDYKDTNDNVEVSETLVSDIIDGINGVVERGSNANGYWVKLADGTQICTHTIAVTFDPTAMGGLYRTSSKTWTYPQSFITIPSVSGSILTTFQYTWLSLGASAATTTNTSFSLFAPSAYTSTGNVGLIAIGRWK